jgi:hypothetical protein
LCLVVGIGRGKRAKKKWGDRETRLTLCDLASRSNVNQNNKIHIGDTCYLKNI